ncbi:MAG: choice-of-anchor D domain-containing protein [Acidobacteriaceae bacterium]
MTDANGNFNITGAYTCPMANPLVYMVATGGNPGLSAASTFIVINELTTVGAVYPLAAFMSSPSAVGSGTGDAAALASAFALAAELVNPATGTSPGTNVPGGVTIPVAQINTIADILASCINSTGGTAGDGSSCGSLFSLTTPATVPATAPATNTIIALLNLANNPALNTTGLYALVPPAAPFQPAQTVTPPDLGVAPIAPATLSVSPSSLSFGPWTTGSTAPSQTVTVTSFSSTAIALSAAISGADASSFAIAGGTCGATLAPSASCTYQVGFSPTVLGALNAFLGVTNSSADPLIEVPLSGGGVALTAGPVTFSQSTLSFNVADTTQDIMVENYGTTPLVISNITISNFASNSSIYADNGYFSQTNNCGVSVPAESVCTISVTSTGIDWAPGEMPVTFTATLTIEDNASPGSQTVALTSTNTSYFGNVSSLNFGYSQLGTSQMQGLSFTSGTYYLSASIVATIGGADPGDFSVSPRSYCSTGGGDGSCPLTVTFDPTATGTRSAQLFVNGTDQYIPLTGTGLGTGPFFTVTPSSVALSSALPSAPDPYSGRSTSITITNYGTTTFGFSGSFSGQNASLFSVNGSNCASVAPGTSCSATISFSASSVGSYPSVLLVKDANSTLSKSVPIAASASYWGVAPFPSQVEFGDQAMGTTSAAQTFVLADLNGYPLGHPLSITLPSPSNFKFTQGSTCPASLTQTCTLAVAFSPYETGSIYEIATATDLTSGDTYSLQLLGAGGVPVVSLNPTSLSFPTRSSGTTSVPMTVTLTNAGPQPLAVSSVSVLGAVNNNFTETNTCTAVAVSGTCSINVTFAPTATGMRSAAIQIVSNAPSSPDTFSVSGTAN